MSPPEKPLDFPDFESSTAPSRFSNQPRVVYSVSELTDQIKSVLEAGFPMVWICGEVSNFRMPASGHCYFTLKDEAAQISAVVFRGQLRLARFTPEDGMSILGLGRLSVYEPRGNYQIILEYMEPAGLGALQLAFEKLKKRLTADGYFDPQRKKPLPFMPSKISVITSPSGAVVHDIITVLSRRFFNLHIEIVPVNVQGPRAQGEICAALALVNERADSDVIILARGGGSIEDLQAFNSEPVAMAILHSDIPVVSAVGHETDVTIADFIADLRAPTPSAAAELVVPEKVVLLRRFQETEKALYKSIMKQLEKLNYKIKLFTKRLWNPRKKIQDTWIRIDDLTGRMGHALMVRRQHSNDRFAWLCHRLSTASPLAQIRKNKLLLDIINSNILNNLKKLVLNKRSNLHVLTSKLEALNPLAILARGYSVTRVLPQKRVLTHPDQAFLGQDVEVLLAGGLLLCNIKGKSDYGEEEF